MRVSTIPKLYTDCMRVNDNQNPQSKSSKKMVVGIVGELDAIQHRMHCLNPQKMRVSTIATLYTIQHQMHCLNPQKDAGQHYCYIVHYTTPNALFKSSKR